MKERYNSNRTRVQHPRGLTSFSICWRDPLPPRFSPYPEKTTAIRKERGNGGGGKGGHFCHLHFLRRFFVLSPLTHASARNRTAHCRSFPRRGELEAPEATIRVMANELSAHMFTLCLHHKVHSGPRIVAIRRGMGLMV